MAEPFSLEFEGANFASALNDIASDVEDEDLPRFMHATMVKLLKGSGTALGGIIGKNPVDTGRSRAAWTFYLEKTGETNPVESPHNPDDGSAKKELGGTTQFIEVTNAVEYIVALEFGHSDQAPGGMVRITMREMAAGSDLTIPLQREIAKTFAEANLRRKRIASRGALPG